LHLGYTRYKPENPIDTTILKLLDKSDEKERFGVMGFSEETPEGFLAFLILSLMRTYGTASE
jgi:hypothetical protein